MHSVFNIDPNIDPDIAQHLTWTLSFEAIYLIILLVPLHESQSIFSCPPSFLSVELKASLLLRRSATVWPLLLLSANIQHM